MQVQGHDLHCCITDIDFSGDLISRVVHCRGHVEIGRAPAVDARDAAGAAG